MPDDDILKEFLIESNENLERLDREMVALENNPEDTELLASIFRVVHTIKGTCGFLNFSTLEKITHQAENILSELRTGQRKLTPVLTTLILDTVDAIRKELVSIERTSKESGAEYEALIRRQQALASVGSPSEPPPAEDVPPAIVEAGKQVTAADCTIRVDVALLNKLMNLVGELVLVRNQILQLNDGSEDTVLNATSHKLNLITTELQGGVMKTRMQPIRMVWSKLPRVVRDLARSCGKDIALEMDGESTELDKTILEAIKDPLTHIVRNSCDHGIEMPEARIRAGKPARGVLQLRAFHEGGNVNIEITDDGAGMDAAKIRETAVRKGLLRITDARLNDNEVLSFVFHPGFSTAREVSSLSGRGVGMDVVRTNIERIGGHVDLATRKGQGTTVKIKIPLTLAIIPGLVVTSCGERFVIPQANLLELVRLEGTEALSLIERVNTTPLFRQRGMLLPLACLSKVLGLAEGDWAERDVISIAILQAEESRFGLIVDGISDTQEIVVKPLGSQLKGLICYAGATIMGDGRVSLILDVPGIARASGILGDSHASTKDAIAGSTQTGKQEERQKLLLFRVGGFERLAVPLALVARLEDIAAGRIERAAGRMAVQYRGKILPLIRVSEYLGSEAPRATQPEIEHVVVFADGEHRIGIIVDEIIDIVEDVIEVTEPSSCMGILGSAVVGGKVTDFIDIPAVIRSFDPGWLEQTETTRGDKTILLADGSAFSRGLVRSYLEIAGHRVIEAANPKEALARLSNAPIDIVVAALDLPGRGAFELLDAIRRTPARQNLPVIALSASAQSDISGSRAFTGCLVKSDRVTMLQSLERLAAVMDQSATLCEVGR